MHGNYLFGEQDVRGKDSILQVNVMKELNVRTGNIINRSFYQSCLDLD